MNRRTTQAHVVFDSLPQPPSAAATGNLRGSTLIEVLVALGIIAVVLTVVLGALQLGVRTVASVNEQTTAIALARSQMETVKNAAWPGPYPALSTPAGYTIQVTSGNGPIEGIQLITVRVQHEGREVLAIAGYKGRR